jgi:hypothetical protein
LTAITEQVYKSADRSLNARSAFDRGSVTVLRPNLWQRSSARLTIAAEKEHRMSEVNPVQPALDAAQQLRIEIKKRMGKESGHMNREMLQYVNTIEGVLRQIPSVQGMFNVINQQSQLVTMTFRNMSKFAAIVEGNIKPGLTNGDDENSNTKGE